MNTSFLVLILMLNPKRIRWRVMIVCCRVVGFLGVSSSSGWEFSRLVKEFFQSDDDSLKLNFSLLVWSAHIYLMFKGVFDSLPYLSEWSAKEEERRKLGRKGWSSLQLLWQIWSTVCIWILCFHFFGHNNFERWVFVCQQPQAVCLQTSNMNSGYKLQLKNTLETEEIFQIQFPHDHVSYVMITDLLIA